MARDAPRPGDGALTEGGRAKDRKDRMWQRKKEDEASFLCRSLFNTQVQERKRYGVCYSITADGAGAIPLVDGILRLARARLWTNVAWACACKPHLTSPGIKFDRLSRTRLT